MGHGLRFVQDNQSSSKRAGTLRGLHFQVPPAAAGQAGHRFARAILDVAVDIRRGSPTFGKHVSTELSADPGANFTFQWALPMDSSPWRMTSSVMYKVSDYYAPERDSGIRWNDPDVAIPWPLATPTSSSPIRIGDFHC